MNNIYTLRQSFDYAIKTNKLILDNLFINDDIIINTIVPFLDQNKSIKYLSMNALKTKKNIGIKGLNALFEKECSFELLNLAGNNIGTDGAKILSKKKYFNKRTNFMR